MKLYSILKLRIVFYAAKLQQTKRKAKQKSKKFLFYLGFFEKG